MPSPFPGMDPYLEGSEWHSFHIEFSSAITRALIPRLRPKYYARTMPYFVTGSSPQDIVISRREIYPDVGTTLKETATAWDITPIQLQTSVPTQIPHVVVEIYAKTSGEFVTAIEILSPANKRSKGYDEYLEKRNRLLQSNIHLIEIDWLRRGQRVPWSIPYPMLPTTSFSAASKHAPSLMSGLSNFTANYPPFPSLSYQKMKTFYAIYRLCLRPSTMPSTTAPYSTTPHPPRNSPRRPNGRLGHPTAPKNH